MKILTNSQGKALVNNNKVYTYEGATPLTAPTISLDTNTVSWSAVTNAVVYGIYAGNENIGYTTGLNSNVKDLLFSKMKQSGTYGITVKAIGDGVSYGASVASNSVSYTYYDVPTDLTNTSWLFTKTSGATTLSTSYFYVNYAIVGGIYSLTDTYLMVDCPTHDRYEVGRRNTLKFMNAYGTFKYYDGTEYVIDNFTLTISGGSNATNTTLINWLVANATRIA